MKYNVQNLAFLSAVIAFASCEPHKKSTITDSGTEVVKIRTPAQDTISKEETPPTQTRTVEGKVIDINQGKDGYTATIETQAKEKYAVTVSHSNLKDPAQYRQVKIGETLKASGDYWKLGNDDQITAREIQ